MPDQTIAILLGEVERQDAIHPAGFEATRDGIRMAMAAMEDELAEAKEAWRGDRACHHYTEDGYEHGWETVATELLQTVAVGVRILRRLSLCDCDPGENCGEHMAGCPLAVLNLGGDPSDGRSLPDDSCV